MATKREPLPLFLEPESVAHLVLAQPKFEDDCGLWNWQLLGILVNIHRHKHVILKNLEHQYNGLAKCIITDATAQAAAEMLFHLHAQKQHVQN